MLGVFFFLFIKKKILKLQFKYADKICISLIQCVQEYTKLHYIIHTL